MPNPIAGTLNRTVVTYPYPGGGAGVPTTGGVIFDASGDVMYIAIMLSGSPFTSRLMRYTYSTDTIEDFAYLEDGVNWYSAPAICWNEDRTKIIAICNSANGSTPNNVYSIQASDGTVTLLGGLLLGASAPGPLHYNVNWGFVGRPKNSRDFYTLDLVAMTKTKFITLPKLCAPSELDDNYLYSVSATNVPGEGPILRAHRLRGFLVEFLAGGGAAAAQASSASNPAYAGFKMWCAEMIVKSGTMYFAHADSGTWYIMAMNLATRNVTRLFAVGGSIDGGGNFGASDDATRFALNRGSGGLKIYI